MQLVVKPGPGLGICIEIETIELVPGVGEPPCRNDVPVRGFHDGSLPKVINRLGRRHEHAPVLTPVLGPGGIFPSEIGEPSVVGGGKIMLTAVSALGPPEDRPARVVVGIGMVIIAPELEDLLEGKFIDGFLGCRFLLLFIVLLKHLGHDDGREYDQDYDDIHDQPGLVHIHHVGMVIFHHLRKIVIKFTVQNSLFILHDPSDIDNISPHIHEVSLFLAILERVVTDIVLIGNVN